MDEKTRIAYAEVFEILGQMDRKIVMRVPVKILEFFKINKKENYISNIDKNDIFNKNNIQQKTLSILAWLNIKYWADEEEQKQLIQKYRKNDYNYELKLKEKFEL